MSFSIDELGAFLSQTGPRQIPPQLKEQLKKPALLLGLGLAVIGSFFFFPVNFIGVYLVWREYSRQLSLLENGEVVMGTVTSCSTERKKITVEFEQDGESLSRTFTPYWKFSKQFEVAARVKSDEQPTALLVGSGNDGLVLFAEALLED